MVALSDNTITYLGRITFRNWGIPFGIKESDRLYHMYVIGRTGTGKSTLLETLMRQDIAHGKGMALLDPHGDLAEKVVGAIPEQRQSDLVYFNASDPSQPYGYNPLKRVVKDKRPLAASGLLEVMKKMWDDAWGPRMEHILRNALLVLLDQEHVTLPDILRLFHDDGFRKRVAAECTNLQVKAFWLTEYPKYSYRLRADGIMPIQNKVGAFLANPILYRILAEPEKTLNFRRIMDEGKILVINLAKGKIGEDSTALLGGLLVTTLSLAAFSRAEVEETKRYNFFLYMDEFQYFTTLSMAHMTAELRKYHVGLILANQFLDQLEPEIRDAVLGNVGTLVSFRLGPKDASLVAKEFDPTFEPTDLLNLPNYHIYLKLMIDGAPSKAFSGVTLQPTDV